MITSINEFNEFSINLKYHLDNQLPIIENIFRPTSVEFFNLIVETRNLFDKNKINLSTEIDNELFINTDVGITAMYNNEKIILDLPLENITINEAEYKNKEVQLNYPKRGGTKKYYVYVNNPKTDKVMKIQFGDTTGLNAKVSDPKARKSFAARQQCAIKKDKTTAGYWACRINKYGHLWGGKTYPGFW
jgi:hypothetical protein